MIVKASGAKITGGHIDIEKLYIPWGESEAEMTQQNAKALFDMISAMAEEQKDGNDRNTKSGN